MELNDPKNKFRLLLYLLELNHLLKIYAVQGPCITEQIVLIRLLNEFITTKKFWNKTSILLPVLSTFPSLPVCLT